jgi:hypothetical protein
VCEPFTQLSRGPQATAVEGNWQRPLAESQLGALQAESRAVQVVLQQAPPRQMPVLQTSAALWSVASAQLPTTIFPWQVPPEQYWAPPQSELLAQTAPGPPSAVPVSLQAGVKRNAATATAQSPKSPRFIALPPPTAGV